MKVEISRTMNATPEKLFNMWTRPELISIWFGVKVEIEPKLFFTLPPCLRPTLLLRLDTIQVQQ